MHILSTVLRAPIPDTKTHAIRRGVQIAHKSDVDGLMKTHVVQLQMMKAYRRFSNI